ncbi:MAG: hypothetical protein OXI49_01255 [Acidobacteriota bacterium]|nr:hypothetical protein [Acidobacteriota bacterium]
MSVATFDTLAAVRNLEKAGMGTSQAEAVTETIRVAVFQGVASKEDIGELRAATQADIAELRVEVGELRAATQADIAELRSEMKAETSDLRTGLEAVRAEVEKARADLTWRMVMALSVLLGILTALDLFFLN